MNIIKKFNRYLVHRVAKIFSGVKCFWLVWTNVGVQISSNVQIFPGVRFQVTDGGRLIVHSGVSIGAGSFIKVQNGVLEIGRDTYIGPWSVICAIESISIGSDVLIAERVSIRDQNHHISSPGLIRNNGLDSSPIVISSNVWIGANAVVLKGVVIENSSVVAAGAIVNIDVPSGVVVAGSPARIVKQISS
jgi:acetyltransferase-like isoleucine patch superfamily enzyme